MGNEIGDLNSSFGKVGIGRCPISGSQSRQGVSRFIASAGTDIVESVGVGSGPSASLTEVIPAVSSERRVVDGYVRVGPNRWSRRGDVSGV